MLDVLITNTRIVDGTGKTAFTGSIGITGETITAVGTADQEAARTIDGTGFVTCPGFVDPHSHADRSILANPRAENLVAQGITTFVGGNCGSSMAPAADNEYTRDAMARCNADVNVDWSSFGQWLSRVEENGLSVNYAPLVGHSAVRGACMGRDFRRKGSADEIKKMEGLVREAMESGAFGMSVGLDPTMPGHFAEREEIVELLKVVREYDGICAPHTRHHQNQWPIHDPGKDAYGLYHGPNGDIITGRYHGLLEAVEMCRDACGITTHIAHMTPAYIIPQPHPEYLDEAAARATLEEIIDTPRSEGLDITYNVIAWEQSIGSLKCIIDEFYNPRLLLPEWLTSVPKEEFIDRLTTGEFRKRVKEVIFSGTFKFGMLHPVTDPYWMDCFRIIECTNKEYAHRTIGEIARGRKPDNISDAVFNESVDVVFDILAEDPDASWALITDKREHRVLPVFLKHPAGMPCTDTIACCSTTREQAGDLHYGTPPLIFGLYPHYIRTFVQEQQVLTLEEAVMKATSVPAQNVFGLKHRGVIREGCFADIVVFDMEGLKENNDFTKPYLPPEGIQYVLVNGTVVYENMSHTGACPGKVLKHC